MSLDVAVIGTRGIPANYGGFETFAQELSIRLVSRGHRVTVYGRSHYIDSKVSNYRGVRIRRLPAIRHKYLDTVSNTTLAILDALFRSFDVILICNAANAFSSWLPRLRGQRVVLNVDGIERRRKKWSRLGQEFYRLSERMAVLFPNAVVTDAKTIQNYYLEKYGCVSYFIPYGADLGSTESREILRKLQLTEREYFLYVSRLEPENNAHLVMEAYLETGLELPLLIVGDAPYSDDYKSRLRERSKAGNIRLTGAIYGNAYKELLSHSLCYLHATEVGGTHPALIEAMGAGTVIIAHDTPENREVLGNGGLLCSFQEAGVLANHLRTVAAARGDFEHYIEVAQERVRERYSWEKITDQYEGLFDALVI